MKTNNKCDSETISRIATILGVDKKNFSNFTEEVSNQQVLIRSSKPSTITLLDQFLFERCNIIAEKDSDYLLIKFNVFNV